MKRTSVASFILAPVLTVLTSLSCVANVVCMAHAQSLRGNAEQDEIIARRWCAACHAVSADQKQASVDAPSFLAVARRWPDAKALAVFLAETPWARTAALFVAAGDRRHRRLHQNAGR